MLLRNRFEVVGHSARSELAASGLVVTAQVVGAELAASDDSEPRDELSGPGSDAAVAANGAAADLDARSAVDHFLCQIAIFFRSTVGDLNAEQMLDGGRGTEPDATSHALLIARRQQLAGCLAARIPEEDIVRAVVDSTECFRVAETPESLTLGDGAHFARVIDPAEGADRVVERGRLRLARGKAERAHRGTGHEDRSEE